MFVWLKLFYDPKATVIESTESTIPQVGVLEYTSKLVFLNLGPDLQSCIC